MASYQTFPQADETKQSPAKKPSMIAVIVAAFCLGAAYVSTSTGPRVVQAAATPAANTVAPASNAKTKAVARGRAAPAEARLPLQKSRLGGVIDKGTVDCSALKHTDCYGGNEGGIGQGTCILADRTCPFPGSFTTVSGECVSCPAEASGCVTETDSVADGVDCLACCHSGEPPLNLAPGKCASCGLNEMPDEVTGMENCLTCEDGYEIVPLYDDCTGLCIESGDSVEYFKNLGFGDLATSACTAILDCYEGDDLAAMEALPRDGTNDQFNETCTIAEFQRDVALDVEDINRFGANFGTSNDKQTLAKSFLVPGENDDDEVKYFLHFYDATTGEEKRDPIPLWDDAYKVAVTNNNDRAAICYASANSYGVIDIPCVDRGNDPESCTFKGYFYDEGGCSSVAMAPDEQTVAFSPGAGSCMGGSVRLHKTYSPQETPVEFEIKPANAEDGLGCARLLAYSSDGTLAVAGHSPWGGGGLVAMYNGTTGELLERVNLGRDGLPKYDGALAYSNDGQTLALGGTKVTNRSADWPNDETDVLMLYDVLNKAVTAEIDLAALRDGQPGSGNGFLIRAAWSPDDKFIVVTDFWHSTYIGVFDAATGAVLDDVKIDIGNYYGNALVDFVGFTGDQCGDACQDLVVSSFLEGPSMFTNNLTHYDVVTLDADDARCQPTPAPVPAPHHSDGATARAAGLAVPALAALAL